MTPTEEQKRGLEEWLADRPPVIQELARRFPPWGWVHLKDDALPITVVYHPAAYNEDGTMSVVRVSVATGEAMWQVFGMKPETLEPCDDPETLRGRLSEADVLQAGMFAKLGMAVMDHRIQKLEDDPDAGPTTPDRALADYLAERLDAAPWVLTRDGEEVMHGEGLILNLDGSFTLEGTLPEDEGQQ